MIKINGEEKKELLRQKPPSKIIFEYPKENIEEFIKKNYKEMELDDIVNGIDSMEGEIKSPLIEKLDFYIKEEAFKKMLLHCYKMALEKKEAMGFLIGDIKYWNREYSIVYDVATTLLDASPFYVRFNKESFENLFDILDEIDYEYVLVGWYHSHVGYSSFMSSIDLETQKKYFNKPFHAAIVLDPITKDMKAFRLINDKCIEIPYAIFR